MILILELFWCLGVLIAVQYEAYEKQQNAIGGNKRKKGIVSATEHGLCFSVTWRNANHFIYYLVNGFELLIL